MVHKLLIRSQAIALALAFYKSLALNFLALALSIKSLIATLLLTDVPTPILYCGYEWCDVTGTPIGEANDGLAERGMLQAGSRLVLCRSSAHE